MNRLELPVNIDLMDTSADAFSRLQQIKVLDTFESGSNDNLHPEGLFSIEIFGRVGSPERDTRFARIETKITLLHPFIFRKLTKLRGLYKDIILGKAYAVWNPEIKDFDQSDFLSGETGYAFFLKHLSEIDFKRTESARRDANITVVTKAIDTGRAFIKNVPVIPAGLRDVYIEPDGRTTEDEINSRYRSLLSSANALPDNVDLTSPAYNNTRVTMQNALNAVFEYFWNMYEGKRGFALNRYYSRGVFNGTRNVISAMDTSVPVLGAPNAPKMNNTVVGLFQTLKALLPVAQHTILNGWIKEAFNAGDGRAYLTNPKTLKREIVQVSRKEYDRFTTPDGIEKIINAFFNRSFRSRNVMISGHYIGLVYRGVVDGKQVFKFFFDIDELPKHLSKRDVYPITYCELLYIAGYRVWNNYPMFTTRYPVAGLGSIYPSYFYVKTTTVGVMRYELDDDWVVKKFHDNNNIEAAYEYPDFSVTTYMETMAPSPSRLAGLSADFDGDAMSLIGIYLDESIEQIRKHMHSSKAYLNPKGGFLNSPRVETVERTIVGLMRR